jgi:hypothetical protein
MGPKAAQVVDAFNTTFRGLFGGRESAEVFDTNVYGASFVEPLELGNFTLFTAANVHFVYVANARDEKQQRIWALLKVYMFLKGEEEQTQFLNRFPDVERKKAKLDRPLGKTREEATLKELNKEYVKALYVVARLKAVMAETSQPNVRLRRRYKEAICVSNYYGAEMYFTQGAFLHVVGELQGGFQDFPITLAEYGDSFVENLGDCLKELQKDDYYKTCEKTLDRISKYFSRAMHALFRSREISDPKNAFVALYRASDAVRLKVRGKEPPALASVSLQELRGRFWLLLELEKCEDLRNRILQLLYSNI